MRMQHKLSVAQWRRRHLRKAKQEPCALRAVRRIARYLHARAKQRVQSTAVCRRHRRRTSARPCSCWHEAHLVALVQHVAAMKLDLVPHVVKQRELMVWRRIAVVHVEKYVRRR